MKNRDIKIYIFPGKNFDNCILREKYEEEEDIRIKCISLRSVMWICVHYKLPYKITVANNGEKINKNKTPLDHRFKVEYFYIRKNVKQIKKKT